MKSPISLSGRTQNLLPTINKHGQKMRDELFSLQGNKNKYKQTSQLFLPGSTNSLVTKSKKAVHPMNQMYAYQ